MYLHDVQGGGDVERLAVVGHVVPQLLGPQLSNVHLVRTKVDKVDTDKISSIGNRDGLVLQPVCAHVDN